MSAGESGVKWFSLLLIFLVALAAHVGTAWLGWKYRDLQVNVEAGRENTSVLEAFKSEARELLENTRKLATAVAETEQQARSTSREMQNALSAAGLDGCIPPDEQRRVLSGELERYNKATGRKEGE